MTNNSSASALRYRPQKFEEVIGQDAIVKTLLNAIKNDSLAQALLFCGPRGVGKTTCARILAKEINKIGSFVATINLHAEIQAKIDIVVEKEKDK